VSDFTPATTPDAASDGRSTRWDDHRTTRRAELAHAARRAVHRHGPDISMEEIAATAGTSKSIVYRYFADKPGLQAAVGAVVVDQMHAALDEASRAAVTPRDGLRSMIAIYLDMVAASPNVYWFVTRPVSEAASAPVGHFLESVAALVARPFARLISEREPLVDVWAAGAVGFVRGMGEWWLTHRDDEAAPSLDELVDRTTGWLWTGPVSALARTRTDAVVPESPAPAEQLTSPVPPPPASRPAPHAPHRPEEPS
jgi:AcrR family transcriptional regulator